MFLFFRKISSVSCRNVLQSSLLLLSWDEVLVVVSVVVVVVLVSFVVSMAALGLVSSLPFSDFSETDGDEEIVFLARSAHEGAAFSTLSSVGV